jgi:hypothetical protein
MAKAVVHADAIAGLLVAAALVRPERSAGMKVSSIKKKLKERSFAPGANRDEVHTAEAVLGLPLDEFIAVAITAPAAWPPSQFLGAASPASSRAFARPGRSFARVTRSGSSTAATHSEASAQSGSRPSMNSTKGRATPDDQSVASQVAWPR